nr:hypothetical protein [Alicyclobacillus pomorum]
MGASVTVLQGVTIGDGAVVGANSVVTLDIPSYTVAVGDKTTMTIQLTGAMPQ